MNLPDFSFEAPLWKKGHTVIGIDEVGRGSFAGPVGVGGVVFQPNLSLEKRKHLLSLGINDSKKLTAKKREELSLQIKELCLSYAISFIDVATIDALGVGKATFLGMREVYNKVNSKYKSVNSENFFALVDGFKIPDVKFPQKGIIHGDGLSISIAAASILAKVERDKLMRGLGFAFQNYAWEENKGYGTLKHRRAISDFGLTKHHRVEFCKNCVGSL